MISIKRSAKLHMDVGEVGSASHASGKPPSDQSPIIPMRKIPIEIVPDKLVVVKLCPEDSLGEDF